MLTEDTHISQIRASFKKMLNKNDLLNLLNEAKPIVYGAKAVPFELKQLTWYANPKVCRNRYIEFKIKKKSGGERSIHSPVKGLKSLQRTMSFVLQCVFEPHKAAMGFVIGKSIVDNARIHERSQYVYNIDLKDFFPSIDQARVWKCLQLRPFNLSGEHELDHTKKIKITINSDRSISEIAKESSSKSSRLILANMIASLCCTEMEVERKNDAGNWELVKRNVLPQGAPTSPVITNIVCQRLDYLLSAVAKRFGLKYSRYADDITFSSMHNVYQKDGDFLKELQRIIADQGFDIKESKTRLQKQGYRQEVTGLLVNDKANVQQRYIKQLRMWLYYWERYGYEKSYRFFLQQYITDKAPSKKGKPDMANVIEGKLDYLRMVRGGDNELYLKLKYRFDALIITNKDKVSETHSILLENLPLAVKTDEIQASVELVAKNPTDKLKINIISLDSVNGQVKLKRKILYDIGTQIPIVEEITNQKLETKEIDLSKHKPLDTNLFLIRFKSSNGLKFLTHKYDIPPSLFNYQEILKIAREEFDELTKQLVIPDRLKARVFQFAFGSPTKGWYFSGTRYNINWQSPTLLKWLDSNPHIHPILNDEFENKLINPFKRSIEIASPQLEELFTKKLAENLKSEYTDFEITTIDLDKASFYTDVDAFQTGIGILINSIKQRSSKSKSLKIEFKRRSEAGKTKRIISIIHLNSICDKPLDRKELLKGDLLQAEEAFLGICDWSIISNSSVDKGNKLNILFDINTKTEARQTIDSRLIEGFTHELTFYS